MLMVITFDLAGATLLSVEFHFDYNKSKSVK